MSSEKNIQISPFFKDNPKAAAIQEAIDGLPDLDPAEMGSLVTKINQAVVLGVLTLTTPQANCLRQLSSKFIPDAPKQINLKADIKTENVILGWLASNEGLLSDAMDRAEVLSPAIDANYALLEEFSDGIGGE